MCSPLASRLRATIRRSPISWAAACKIHLRPYQREVARAIKDSILNHRGLTIVVIFPRQSGKNEVQAHIFSWLLFRYASVGGRIVSVSPTFKPQTTNNMDRVKSSLDKCVGSRGLWKSSKGYIYQLGKACLQFFSGEPRANVVGATADLLLSVDEAQSISSAKFDKDFDPMTASTNATRVFWGTAWTSNTLLERERRAALQAEKLDGIRRVFFYTAEDVMQTLPSYRAHVEAKIARHGRNHPLIRSQYFCETIDAQSGLFNPARLALMISSPLQMYSFGEGPGVGSDSPSRSTPVGLDPAKSPKGEQSVPTQSKDGVGSGAESSPSPNSENLGRAGEGSCAFLLDVAGMDESKTDPLLSYDTGLGNPGRDSTTLTIVEIDLSTLEALQKPTYHVVARRSWTGENHVVVFGKLKALAETWNPQKIVIDATGVGEGLWAMLDRQFPSRVIPVKFSQQEKSEIGWGFLNIIETGRFRDHCHTDEVRLQYAHCISEILPGPQKILRWGVPDGTRGPNGELIHDDFILADSLTAKLDELEWYIQFETFMIPPPPNELDEIDRRFGLDSWGDKLWDPS